MDLVALQGLLTAFGIIGGVGGLLTVLAFMEPDMAKETQAGSDVESNATIL